MKVQVLQENLVRALALVGPVVPSRAMLPILETVKLETEHGRLRVSGYDLETRVTCWVGMRELEAGTVLAPYRQLRDLAKGIGPEVVTLEGAHDVKEDGKTWWRKVGVSAKDVEASLHAMNPEDYPLVSCVEEEVFGFAGGKLLAALARVVTCVAEDESRPVLTTVKAKLENGVLTLAAADGFRLAVDEVAGPEGAFEVMFPASGIRHVLRCLRGEEVVTAAIAKSGRSVRFEGVDVEVCMALVEGTYPNYGQLIPAERTTLVTVDGTAFRRAVKLASTMARDGSGIVRLEVDPAKGLTVSARADERGSATVQLLAAVDGPAGKIAFNMRYLADVLALMPGDVTLTLKDPSTQGIFRGAGLEGFLVLVMPMFVQW